MALTLKLATSPVVLLLLRSVCEIARSMAMAAMFVFPAPVGALINIFASLLNAHE